MLTCHMICYTECLDDKILKFVTIHDTVFQSVTMQSQDAKRSRQSKQHTVSLLNMQVIKPFHSQCLPVEYETETNSVQFLKYSRLRDRKQWR